MNGLSIEKLTIRFGGLTAVDGVTLEVPEGRITGLIGPNGAGKTTIFNACSGLVPVTEGSISLSGEDLTVLPAQRRAQRGLGRTFQRLELFDSLTVRENVAMGREGYLAGSRVLGQLVCSRRERAEIDQAVSEALELCDIGQHADTQAGALSTGQRRLVELARTLAGPFRILLLDEPSSGLDPGETARFGEILQKVVSVRSLGSLLVEHDMQLVMSICDYIYVLDFGCLIFEGTPTQVGASDVVRAAYLGTEAA
jgi:ABC-type branched-subunit amino acid transport system ATPase component